MSDDAKFYWCKTHDRVEQWPDVCNAMNRMGPYDSPEAARNYKQKAQDRNEAWEEQDERWDRWPGE